MESDMPLSPKAKAKMEQAIHGIDPTLRVGEGREELDTSRYKVEVFKGDRRAIFKVPRAVVEDEDQEATLRSYARAFIREAFGSS